MPEVAACYLRRSKDDPKQVSIGRQRDLCLASAKAHGYEIHEDCVFIDEGITGALLERPGLEAMLALVRSGTVRAVFIADDDRLSRDYGHAWLINEELKRSRVQLFVKDKPADYSPEGVIHSGLMSLFAQYECAKTAERMRLGKLHRARLGKPLGSYETLGYLYVSDTPEAKAHYRLVPEEAQLVQRIFQMYLAGHGILKIASILTSERIPTKSDRLPSRKSKKQRPRGVWSRSSIHRILRNETYATGIMHWNKYEAIEPDPKNRRKPRNLKVTKTAKRLRDRSEWIELQVSVIIDPETFAKAQEQIFLNSQKNRRRRKHEYLFLRGRLRCGHCGFAMSGQMSSGRYPHRRYVCTGRLQRMEAPCRKSVSAELLEVRVWEVLWNNLLSDPSNLKAYIEQKRQDAQQHRSELSHVQQRLSQVDTALETLATKQQRLLDLYLDGHLDQNLFSSNKSTLDQSREQLESLRKELQAKLNAEGVKQQQVDHAISYVQGLIDNLPNARVCLQIITRV